MAEDIDKFRFVEQDSFPYTECRGFVRPGMAALFKNYILPSDRQCLFKWKALKRITVLFLAVILCLCLAACSKEPEPKQNPQEIQTELADTEKGVEAMPQESRDDAAYPGADVVEIVNLRGDKTTIYKLADGTYMDRIDRHFTYNGTDIWTDDNGAGWNEVAKD